MSVSPPKRPRGSRSLVGVIVALVVLALAVLGAIAAVQVHSGDSATVLGNVHSVTRWLRGRSWHDGLVVAAGGVLAGLGVLALLAAVLPARHRLLAVHETHPGVTSGITRRGLRADLAAVAEGVDGVASAKARVGRRRVRLRVESKLRDRTGIEDGVVAAVTEELDRLALERARTVRARVSGPDPDPPVPDQASEQKDEAVDEPETRTAPATSDEATTDEATSEPDAEPADEAGTVDLVKAPEPGEDR